MRRPLLMLLAAPALSGCFTLLPKTVPAQFYRFGVEAPAPSEGSAAPTAPAPPSVGVVLEPVDLPRASTSDGILTMTGDKAAYLAGARWVAPARILFQEALQRRLELGAGPARLASIADGSARGFLSVAVTRFEADYAGDGPPTARVALVARLVERDGEVLGEVRVSEEAKASANAVSAIVAALDLATREAVAKVGAFADEAVLRAHAPGARPAALNR